MNIDWRGHRTRGRARRWCFYRQPDLEASVTWFGDDSDVSAMSADDDPVANVQPNPAPLPTSLVVKNGSKMRSWISSGMPGPLSEISTSNRSRS